MEEGGWIYKWEIHQPAQDPPPMRRSVDFCAVRVGACVVRNVVQARGREHDVQQGRHHGP